APNGSNTSASPSSAAVDNVTINVASEGAGLSELCYNFANQLGYFKQNNVNIGKEITFQGDSQTVAALVSQSVQMANVGVAAAIPVAKKEQNQPVIVAGKGYVAYDLVGDASIKSVSGLKGKTIALGDQTQIASLGTGALLDEQVGKGSWNALYLGGGSG